VEAQLVYGHCLVAEPATVSMHSENGAGKIDMRVPRKVEAGYHALADTITKGLYRRWRTGKAGVAREHPHSRETA
jgi:hypothetical protein